MTFGQLFTQMHPDIRVKENGTCVWLYIDDVNHYTFGADWWNAEIKEQPDRKAFAGVPMGTQNVYWTDATEDSLVGGSKYHDPR